MTKPIPYLIQGKNIVLLIGSTPHTISESHISYTKIREAIISKSWDLIPDLVNAREAIKKYATGVFEIVDGIFYRNGKEVHNALADKIVEMYAEGFDVQPMINFVANLEQNPSKRAVEELYEFLEKSMLPITEDGFFLAYKKVRGDYYDIHSGTVLNKPANLLTNEDKKLLPYTTGDVNEVTVEIADGLTKVSMPRNAVDDDKDNTCSNGLHFCSMNYLNHFGGSHNVHIVVLKINPKDVVSIPSDYNATKGRASEYIIVGEVEDQNNPQSSFKSSVDTSFTDSGIRKNSRGQWIDGRGKFLAKHLIPD